MPNLIRNIQLIFLLLASLALTASTVVLGGLPLRLTRSLHGKGSYWVWSLLVAAGLLLLNWYYLSVLFLSMVILVGVYCDLEETQFSLFYRGFFAVFLTLLFLGVGFSLWVFQTVSNWYLELMTLV